MSSEIRSTTHHPRLVRHGRATVDSAPDLLDAAADLIVSMELASRDPRAEVLAGRRELARRVADGHDLDVSPDTATIRHDPDWRVAPLPAELAVRQVELATPATADHARSALASGADVWVADLEDSLVPRWDLLMDAHRVIAATAAERSTGRPVLMVRPRGLHLDEAHLEVDGAPVSAAVADVAIFLAGQAQTLLDDGSAPYLYLPKVEGHQDALWWDELLTHAEQSLGLPTNTVRVSVLVETVTSAYQLEEILHALRGRITCLAAGRWDYVFSHVRTYASRGDQVMPDLESFTMNTRFLRTYTNLLVRTCQRRGAQAIGGPVTLVPGGPFDASTLQAQARLTRDKTREAREGFTGAWVRHPAQVELARAPFAGVATQQVSTGEGTSTPDGPLVVDAQALSDISGLPGSCTLSGLRGNLRAALGYLVGWLAGEGTAVIDGTLHDIGTLELSRFQVWQWRHHRIRLAEGPEVSPLLLSRMIDDEVELLRRRVGDSTRVRVAQDLLADAVLAEDPPAFLATLAYRALLDLDSATLAEDDPAA